MKHWRALAATLALTTAAITGISLNTDISTQMDTTWGAPDTTAQSPVAELPDAPPITTLRDTTWG